MYGSCSTLHPSFGSPTAPLWTNGAFSIGVYGLCQRPTLNIVQLITVLFRCIKSCVKCCLYFPLQKWEICLQTHNEQDMLSAVHHQVIYPVIYASANFRTVKPEKVVYSNICLTAKWYVKLCSNQISTHAHSIKMSCTEIPAFQIPQENPEEDEQIHFQRGITKRTEWWWEYVYFCVVLMHVLSDKSLVYSTYTNKIKTAVSCQQSTVVDLWAKLKMHRSEWFKLQFELLLWLCFSHQLIWTILMFVPFRAANGLCVWRSRSTGTPWSLSLKSQVCCYNRYSEGAGRLSS